MAVLVKCGALSASLIAFAALVGFGSFLAAVEQSGAQVFGSLLAFAGIIAFAAALLLLFAPAATFEKPGGRALAQVSTVLALAPLVAMDAAIGLFARPFGSAAPALDAALVIVGLVLAVGAVCIVALGSARARRGPRHLPDSVHRSVDEAARRNALADAAPALRGTFDPHAERRLPPGAAFDFDDEIRVTRV